MKQVLQDLANGNTILTKAPTPSVSSGNLLISTCVTLVSAGTERMLVDFGRASYLQKARQQPEKVKLVLAKMQTDGIMTTIDAVQSKLAQPLPLGYCNVGVVNEVGKNVAGFKVGDRVASNGSHSEIVNVPQNLCARIPDNVSNQQAAFTILGSIGLQGIRLAKPTLGETFVVTGVGLIGLLTVQLLRAHGCRVLAIDFDTEKLSLAKQFGAEVCNPSLGEDPIAAGIAFSRGIGVDGVIITASTKSNDPVTQAARMCRKRGRIILVGVTGLELNRSDFYEKELTFQVSCSYGPGRYDPSYEEQGHDYPSGFVRWTEQRNFEAVLDMLASGHLNVDPLISHRFAFENATAAYQVLSEERNSLGILLEYTAAVEDRIIKSVVLNNTVEFSASKPVLGMIGAGNYSSRVLIPAFKKSGAQLHTIVTAGGINGVIHGKKSGFSQASTDVMELLSNEVVNTIAIATRHNSHAYLVKKAIEAGKNVFVEKPLAINIEDLEEIESIYYDAHANGKQPHLMVGFNRRFAPQVKKMKALLNPLKVPKSFIMTMNSGDIPADHWTQDLEVGGGRIIGEACHFIDLMRFLADSPITSVQAQCMGNNSGIPITEDKASIILTFEDGSFGTIHYLANGSASFPKERIEVFVAGRILQLDNFRRLKGFGWPGFRKLNLWKQDKGQTNCTAEFLSAITEAKPTPISSSEIFEVAKVSIDVASLLRSSTKESLKGINYNV